MVSPGFIETEAPHSWIMQIAQREGIGEEAARQQIIARSGGIALGRTGRPAEIAELGAFLPSDRAAFASGVDYFLAGGAFPARWRGRPGEMCAKPPRTPSTPDS